ncbi:MAG: 7-cyano-7-deazaguanine synthase [Nanoarchaeota archaeon]
MKKKKAIVLCSGGLDSVVAAFYVSKILKYDKIIVLFFDYGQKSVIKERKSAKKCSEEVNGKFMEIKLPELGMISCSLINKEGNIKKLKRENLKNTEKESAKWYVPCRNSVFLIYSLALAESIYMKEREIYDIFLGLKCEGKESYPDSTREFIREMNKLSRISCLKEFRIRSPLIKKDKEDIILLGKKLGVDFKNTFSCYVGGKKHCGECLACMLRKEGFYWAGIKDPTAYAV